MSRPQPGQPEPDPQPGASWPPPPTAYQPYPQYQPYQQYPVPQPVYVVPAPRPPRPPTTATSYVSCGLGLVAMTLGWIPFVGIVTGIGLGVLGLILGLKALRLVNLGYVTDRAAAITGVVTSIFGIAIGVLSTGAGLIALAIA